MYSIIFLSLQSQNNCLNGYFNQDEFCVCYPGYTYTDGNKTSCQKCPEGQISPGQDHNLNSGCYDCNNFSSNPDLYTDESKIHCYQCQYGSYDLALTNQVKVCKCQPGFEFNLNTSECQKCTGSFYLDSTIINSGNQLHKCQDNDCSTIGQNYEANHYHSTCVCKEGYYGTNCQYKLNQSNPANQNQIAYSEYLNQTLSQPTNCDNGALDQTLNNSCMCDAGYSVSNLTHTCIPCEEGTFQPQSNYKQNQCQELICGDYATVDSIAGCICQKGFQPDGQNGCTPCAFYQYKIQDSNDSCQDCIQQSIINYKRDQCDCSVQSNDKLKYYQNDINKMCNQSCNNTQYIVWDANQQKCSQLPSNAAATINSRDVICANGKYWQQSNQCTNLPQNTVTTLYNQSEQISCIKYTRVNQSIQCECDYGYFWNKTFCDICPHDLGVMSNTSNRSYQCNCGTDSSIKWKYNQQKDEYMCMCNEWNKQLVDNTCVDCFKYQYYGNDDLCHCGGDLVLNANNQCVCKENYVLTGNDSTLVCTLCSNNQVRKLEQDTQKCLTEYQYQDWSFI